MHAENVNQLCRHILCFVILTLGKKKKSIKTGVPREGCNLVHRQVQAKWHSVNGFHMITIKKYNGTQLKKIIH